MRIPVRKCLVTLKVSVVLILVITVLGLFEFWRGGRRKVGAYAVYGGDSPESEYERLIAEDEAKIIPGLGEGGMPAFLMGQERIAGEESLKKLAINVHLSDRISYNRTLRDVRNDACQRVMYSAELPSVSVVIIFHNEPYSVVLRTVWSVLNSAKREHNWYKNANYIDNNGAHMNLGYKGQNPKDPYLYLKEIILVDDNSTLPELKDKLSHYVNTRMPKFIKILRLPERRGLMAARITGAHAARGSVLVFLDAHCEVQADWLRPLLQRVKEKKDAVVSPVIDVINQETFELDAADYFQIGGFTFDGHFNWIEIPSWEKMRRGTDISPTWSPTMAGGLFAVDRAYFWSIGGYDEQMSGWGGENLEMSFRIWQCGGTVEIIPCSRVGHVFRAFHPYSAGADSHGINTARAASVWMDDYAELYYLYRPDLRENPIIGDLTHRKILREKLKCKSFDWYLQNIYKEKYVPLRDSVAFGRFRNPITGLCLDSLQSVTSPAVLGLYPCHGTLQPSQQYSLSHSGQLRDEQLCVTVPNSREDKVRRIVRTPCHEGAKSQEWHILESGQIRHEYTGLCLSADSPTVERPGLKPCVDDEKQKWTQDLRITPDGALYYDSNIISSSQMESLKHLPKLSRLSRSLQQKLSSTDDQTDALATIEELPPAPSAPAAPSSPPTPPAPPDTLPPTHGFSWQRFPVTTFPVSSNPMSTTESNMEFPVNMLRNREKKKTRNNFLLKVLRSLPNGTEQHLEMSIFCKHRKLFPNNSFVRDLVTMFNKYNITVINKGRIFERNRVVALAGRDRAPNKRTRFQKVNITQEEKRTTRGEMPRMKVITIETTTEEITTTEKRKLRSTTDDFWYLTGPTETDAQTRPSKKHKKIKKKKKKTRTKSSKKHTIQPVMHSIEAETTNTAWRQESLSNERAKEDILNAQDRELRSKAMALIQGSRQNDLEADSAEITAALMRARKHNRDKSTYLENEVKDSIEVNLRPNGSAHPTSVEVKTQAAVIDADKMETYHDKSVYFEEDDIHKGKKPAISARRTSLEGRTRAPVVDDKIRTYHFRSVNFEEDENHKGNKPTISAHPTSRETKVRAAVIDADKMETYHDKSVYFEEDENRKGKKANIKISGGKINMLSLDLQEKPHEITLYVNKRANLTTTRAPVKLRDPPELQRAYEELRKYEVGDIPRKKLLIKNSKRDYVKRELELEGTDAGDTDQIGKIRININGSRPSEAAVEDETEKGTDEIDELLNDVKRVMEARANKSGPPKARMTYKVSMQNEDDDSDEAVEED